jgi:hypothetical protein
VSLLLIAGGPQAQCRQQSESADDLGIPVTRIDTKSNAVVRQWIGDGGDSIRTGLGSVWVTNLRAGIVWRIPPENL